MYLFPGNFHKAVFCSGKDPVLAEGQDIVGEDPLILQLRDDGNHPRQGVPGGVRGCKDDPQTGGGQAVPSHDVGGGENMGRVDVEDAQQAVGHFGQAGVGLEDHKILAVQLGGGKLEGIFQGVSLQVILFQKGVALGDEQNDPDRGEKLIIQLAAHQGHGGKGHVDVPL